MKKAVMQNAGVNVYEKYFDKTVCANVLQCLRHPDTSNLVRSHEVSTIENSNNFLILSVPHLKYHFP